MKKDKHALINLQAAKIATIKRALLAPAVTNTKAEVIPQAKLLTADAPVAVTEVAGKTATLQVEFHDVDAGLSDFTATYKGQGQTLQESGTISFSNVKPNDTITIKGDSGGSTQVIISGVNADPMQMDFAAGQHIGGLFFILP